MISFYSEEETARMKKRARAARVTAAAALAASVLGCVGMCLLVNTLNARAMLIRVIVLSVLGGWAALLVWVFSAAPAGAAAGHMRRILDGEEEEREGVLRLTGEPMTIPRSVTVLRAVLEEEDGRETRLSVLAGKEKELPPPGSRVRVRIVHGFAAGVEELP